VLPANAQNLWQVLPPERYLHALCTEARRYILVAPGESKIAASNFE